jgi:subtilisin family serine protease
MYSINLETEHVQLIRAGDVISVLGESKLVEYDPSKDLCKKHSRYDCSPNFVVSTDQQTVDWGMIKIRMPEVWASGVVGSTNVVAVLDTGVDCRHPDLKCIGEYDAITNKEGTGTAWDGNGHGTHVTGIVGAIHNAYGVRGVSNVPIFAVKFLGENGSGSLFHAIRGIDKSIQRGARVINASWGCTGCYSRPLEAAIRRAEEADILFVAAAGNRGVNNDDNHHYPSDYKLDNIISVASSTPGDTLSSFSNYSATSVDIAAPGQSILSTWKDGGYNRISGTSMAAPHVSGVAALLEGNVAERKHSILHNARTVENLKSRLVSGAVFDGYGAVTGTPQEPPNACKPKALRKCWKRNCKKLRRQRRRWKRCRLTCRKKFNCVN